MKNAVVRSVFAVGVLLILTPGTVQAQDVTYELKPPGQEQAAKSAQLECPETLLVGQILQFNGTFENQGQVIIPEASFTVTVTPEFVLSSFTMTQGAWTTAPQNATLDMGAVDPGVTVTFSFNLTAVAAGDATLEIQFSGQDPENCTIVVEDPPVENFVEVDQWDQTTALVQLVGEPFGERPTPFILRGPTEAHVFFEGENEGIAFDDNQNGLDEVQTELVALNLTDGTITLTLNPEQRSVGQIEETVNTTRGLLDLPPFGQGDADSFFDVLFQVDVGGGLVLHNQLALQIQATISHKPPFERYIHLIPPGGPIELLDQNNNRTGIFIVRAEHDTGFFDLHRFTNSTQLSLVEPTGGSTTVELTGTSALGVFYEGNSRRAAQDDDGDGKGEVDIELVSLNLTGQHPTLGPIMIHLRDPNQSPFMRSEGEMEERTDVDPDSLDPFGFIDAFVDVFVEVKIGSGESAMVFHNEEPKRVTTSFVNPLAPVVLTGGGITPLVDENGQPSGLGLGSVTQTDTPVSVEVDRVGEEIPTGFELEPNYPNPFTRQTVIPLGVPQASPVQIEVYDVLGRRVATLVDGILAAGRHEVTWSPQGLPAGLYLVRLTVGNVVLTQRATLLR